MKYIYLILLSVLLFDSCNTTKKAQEQQEQQRKALDSWMGAHKSKLIQSWGAPTRYEDDGAGGQILVYEKSIVLGYATYNTYAGRTVTSFTKMYAHSDGILYHWRTGTR